MNEQDQFVVRAQLGAQAIGILDALVSGKSSVLSKQAHPIVRRQVQELIKAWNAALKPEAGVP